MDAEMWVSIGGSVITIASVLWGLGAMRGRIEQQLQGMAQDVAEIKAGKIAPCVQHAEQIGRLQKDVEVLFRRTNQDHRHSEIDC